MENKHSEGLPIESMCLRFKLVLRKASLPFGFGEIILFVGKLQIATGF